MKPGLLLINLGTPDAPTPSAVRRYLKEFLSDPEVIDLPAPLRWLLLNTIILPRRPKASAAAYAKVWTEAGSPLLVHSQALTDGVTQALPDWRVVLAMRYGNPSIAAALQQLESEALSELVVLPLYPQRAASSTGSSIAAVRQEAAQRLPDVPLRWIDAFHDEPGFLETFVKIGQAHIAEFEPEHILFSFHGLPERHMRAADPSGQHCLERQDCCEPFGPLNQHCYRAQCFATARAIAAGLPWSQEQYTICFQSRLGRTPWIQPFTDRVLLDLAQRGVRRLAVFCPAFVADCLETLEEIELRAAEDFRAAGGEALRLVPSLNAHPHWIATVAEMAQRAIDG